MTKLTSLIRRKVDVHAPHGVKPQFVVTLYPNGTMGLRELGRRSEFALDLGELYVWALKSAVNKADRLAKKYRAEGMSRRDARIKAQKEAGLRP